MKPVEEQKARSQQQGQHGQQELQQAQPLKGQQAWPEQRGQRGQHAQQVQPVVEEVEAGALKSLQQMLLWEGTLHPTWRLGAVEIQGCMSLVQEVVEGDWRVSRLSTWIERKRLFDPGG